MNNPALTDQVNVAAILNPLCRWLEAFVPLITKKSKRYVNKLHILRAFQAAAAESQMHQLSHQRFIEYCLAEDLKKEAQWTESTFIRECYNTSSWLLAPASYRLNMPSLVINQIKDHVGTLRITIDNVKSSRTHKLQGIPSDLSDAEWLLRALIRLDRQGNKHLTGIAAIPILSKAPFEQAYDELAKKEKASRPVMQGRKLDYWRNKEQSFFHTGIQMETWEITSLNCLIQTPAPHMAEQSQRWVISFKTLFEQIVSEYGGEVLPNVRARMGAVFGHQKSSVAHTRLAVQAALALAETAKYLAKKMAFSQDTVHCIFFVQTKKVDVTGKKLEHVSSDMLNGTDDILKDLDKIDCPYAVVLRAQTFALIDSFFFSQPLLLSCGDQCVSSAQPMVQVHKEIEKDKDSTIFDSNKVKTFGLMGRQSELKDLQAAWETAKKGTPQVVWVQGMLGIGRSHLIFEFLRRTKTNDRPQVLICQCWDYRQHHPFYPVAEMLRLQMKIKKMHKPRLRQERIRGLPKTLGLDLGKNQEVLETLLSSAHVNPLDPAQDTQSDIPAEEELMTIDASQIMAILESMLQYTVRNGPLVLVVEDYQWADDRSRRLLKLFLEYVRNANLKLPLLVVISTRNRRHLPGNMKSDFSRSIPLKPLDDNSAEQLVYQLDENKGFSLSDDKIKTIVRQAEGIPDVLWELTMGYPNDITWYKKVLCESETDFEGTSSKYVAQKAAVQGQEFSLKFLKAQYPEQTGSDNLPASVDQQLGILLERGLVRETVSSNQSDYQFTCGHIHECFYQSMSSYDRKKEHLAIAKIVEKQSHFKSVRKKHPEILAWHYRLAGTDAVGKAAKWMHKQALDGLKDSNYAAAIDVLEDAIALLPEHPKKTNLQKLKLTLHLDVARAYAVVKGSGSRPVQEAYQMATKIVSHVDGPMLKFRTQWGNWLIHYSQAKLTEAQQVAQGLLNQPGIQTLHQCHLEAHHAMWNTLFHMGHLRTAMAFHFHGLAVANKVSFKKRRFDNAVFAGHDPQVCCLSRGASVLWFRGFCDGAVDASQSGIELAEKLRCPSSQSHANCYASLVHALRREHQESRAYASKAAEIAQQHSLKQRQVMAQILGHVADYHLTQQSEWIDQIEQDITEWKSTGVRLFETFWSTLLAECCLSAEQIPRGLDAIKTAFTIMEETHECFYQSELYRLKGELLWASSSKKGEEAEKNFQKACQTAHDSDTRILELRAQLSLNRLMDLRNENPQKKHARQELNKIYQWFREGFETKDMKEVII